MQLDQFSKKILRILQEDGRITVQDLAVQAGLSTSPCWRRLKELEESGIIRRYAALLDRRRLGLNLCMIVQVTLLRHAEGTVESFETRILECPEVVECYETTGDADYVLKVFVPDIDAFNAFLHDSLLKLPGIAQVRSSVALKEIKYDTALPL
ncbi:MAG: Lrp/AsnC family transcriptional regulator [Pseudomonadota bacterium]